MVMKFDQLVNGAINVGFGAAAVAVEGGKKVRICKKCGAEI